MIQIEPKDGGPIYAETDLTSFIAEPWNAVSSLAILLPAIYWAIKLRGRIKDYSFLYFCIPLLFFGGLGSTLFHAFRSSGWLLLMDVLPTAILTFSVSIYFWVKVLPRWQFVFLIIPLIVVFRVLIFRWLDPPHSINVGYLVTGTLIFVPLLLYLRKTSFQGFFEISVSILLLIIALFFREKDHQLSEWFSVGSHFIWHLCSGIGAFFLGQYLYKLRSLELSKTHTL
jgi:hemolysin III